MSDREVASMLSMATRDTLLAEQLKAELQLRGVERQAKAGEALVDVDFRTGLLTVHSAYAS